MLLDLFVVAILRIGDPLIDTPQFCRQLNCCFRLFQFVILNFGERAYMLTPNIFLHQCFGKVISWCTDLPSANVSFMLQLLFVSLDIVVGILIGKLLALNNVTRVSMVRTHTFSPEAFLSILLFDVSGCRFGC